MKRICLLIGERRTEGLRLAVGLTLADNEVSVLFDSHGMDDQEAEYVSALDAMGAKVLSGNVAMEEAVHGSDHVLRY